jgi:hypothetical protein
MDRIITSLGTMGVEVADGVTEASIRKVGVEDGVVCEAQPIKVSVRRMKIEIRLRNLWECNIYIQFIDGTSKVCKTGASRGPSG